MEANAPTDAAMLRDQGEIHAAEWSCPALGFTEPREPSAECAETLSAVESVCHASGMRTCPLYYTRLPWVTRALNLYRGRKLGIARALEPEPSATMCEAMLTLDSASTARQAREWERAEEERKRHAAEGGR